MIPIYVLKLIVSWFSRAVLCILIAEHVLLSQLVGNIRYNTKKRQISSFIVFFLHHIYVPMIPIYVRKFIVRKPGKDTQQYVKNMVILLLSNILLSYCSI